GWPSPRLPRLPPRPSHYRRNPSANPSACRSGYGLQQQSQTSSYLPPRGFCAVPVMLYIRTNYSKPISLGYLCDMTAEQTDARTALATALVTAIDHVGIAVPDLDVAIKWYHDHLGMIVLHEEVNEEQGIREAMLSVRGAPVGSAQVQL